MHQLGTRGRRKPSIVIVAIACAVLASVLVMGAAAADGGDPAADGSLSKGRIPPAAVQADGSLDESLVPDYIPASDRAGKVVGWVATRDLGMLGGTPLDDITVYGDDLSTVVGVMVEGRGFVATGQDIESVPTFEVRVSAEDEG